MYKIDGIKLENAAIKEIKKISRAVKFSINSPLYYEGQIPVVAYLVIDGAIQLLKNKKIKQILKPGAMIGLSELMTNSPSKTTAEVKAESIVCFLDKSTILEVIQDDSSSLAELFNIKEK